MTSWTVRDRRPGDDAALRALNQANVPEVGPLDDERLALFAEQACRFQVVVDEGAVLGLFVGLTEGVPYDSPNYRWFSERHERFAYVDRIALAPELRGEGVADALYAAFEDLAASTGRPVVCAEVNVEPPNPRSMRFHERRGFEVVGEQAPYGTDERVAMVEKRTSAGG
ncbi:MAG: GNAT family N-acetyltransferase [Acidimicrobiia bacterium]